MQSDQDKEVEGSPGCENARSSQPSLKKRSMDNMNHRVAVCRPFILKHCETATVMTTQGQVDQNYPATQHLSAYYENTANEQYSSVATNDLLTLIDRKNGD